MFSLITKNPTIVFETKNPLDSFETKTLFDDLPRINDFQVDDEKKYRIEHNSIFLQKKLLFDPVWKKLNAHLNSDLFLKNLKSFSGINGNKIDNLEIISINPIKNFINIYIRKKVLIRTNFEISILYNNSSIVPHTDSKNKIYTMMLYSPSSKQKNDKNLGTAFHSVIKNIENYKNFENIHKKDLNFKNFFYDTKITLRSKFNDAIITGFFKSDFSWHSVPKIKMKKNEDRKSLNINIYRTKQEVFLLLIDRIKFLVKCIFSKK